MAENDPRQTDYRPSSAKAEIHIGYNCNLSCRFCNRGSFLHDPHTKEMSLSDVNDFLNQARELSWYPGIVIIGGEPTLHPEIDEICAACRQFANEGVKFGKKFGSSREDIWEAVKDDDRLKLAIGYPAIRGTLGQVQLWSNQTTKESREICKRLSQKGISIVEQTIKQGGTIPIQVGRRPDDHEGYEFDIRDMFVSPDDLGYGIRPACWQSSISICGISVDAEGYSPCSIGGAIAGVLGSDFRTKRLADLFDIEKVAEIHAETCRHCGSCLSRTGINGIGDDGNLTKLCEPEEWQEKVEALPKWRGMPVSETWAKALEGRK